MAMVNEKDIQQIERYLNSIANITPSDIHQLVSQARQRTFKKNELFLSEGEVCKQLLFVHEGAFRYFLTKDGDDFTKDFCLDSTNPFCTGFTSFITQTPSLINIDALEDARVSVWSSGYIRALFETMPWIKFAKAMAEALYIRKEKREISMLRDTAEERYQKFVKEFKDVTQRAAQYHIASYLGITPETLSRIRKKIVNPKGLNQ